MIKLKSLITEPIIVKESKNDWVASYKKTSIFLKDGYKHASDDQLEKIYDILGDALKKCKIPIKSVIVNFQENK